MSKRMVLITIILLLSINSAFSSEIWITSNNSKIFYSKERYQLLKIDPKVNVFKFYYQVIQRTPKPELERIFNFLRENNIKVAIEVPGLTWVDHGIGYGVEGFGPSFFQKDLMNRIHDANGYVNYFAIDEVLWYAHYNEKTHIQYNINDIADQVSKNIDEYYSLFPHAQIGIIEPLSQIYQKDKFSGIQQFIDEFNKRSKYALKFINYDVLWSSDFKRVYDNLINFSTGNDLTYGVIFNDNSNANPKLWMENARDNIKAFYKNQKQIPEQIIYQSWNKSPYMNFYVSNSDSLGSLPEYASKIMSK